MTERRYGDEEVREIFSLATMGGAQERHLPAESGGLTLDDLQRIGREAGIDPARVAQAAEKLDTGGLREWTQGDLYISLEPTAHGEQLRLSAHNNVAIVLNGLGFVTGGMAVLMGAVAGAAGKPEKALVVLGMFGAIALASLGATLIRSPRWARERGRQMKTITEQAVKLLSHS